MEITDLQLYPIETRRESGSITPHVIVTLETKEGVTGVGEMSDLGHGGGAATVPSLQALRESLMGILRGRDPHETTALVARLEERFPGLESHHSEIRCGIEIALWDTIAKAANVPLHDLLGGKVRDRYRVCYPVFRMSSVDAVKDNLRRVRDRMAQGQDCFRLYWAGNIEADERFLAGVREEWGDSVEIKSLDGGKSLPRDEAISALRRLMKYNPTHIESTCGLNENYLEDMRAVREETGLLLSEHIRGFDEALRFVEARAIDIFNISLVSLGGITQARKVYALAEMTGMKTLIGTTQELSIGTAAQLHLGAAMPNLDVPGDTTGPLLYQQDVVKKRVQYEKGSAVVPEGVGLGMELDNDALQANAATFG